MERVIKTLLGEYQSCLFKLLFRRAREIPTFLTEDVKQVPQQTSDIGKRRFCHCFNCSVGLILILYMLNKLLNLPLTSERADFANAQLNSWPDTFDFENDN